MRCGPSSDARAGDDLDEVLRQPRLLEQCEAPQRGERRLAVGLDDHRVAGRERGRRVADAQRQRVVPRRDDPHHAERVAVLVGGGQHRERAAAALRLEVPGGGVRVVAGHDRDVEDLLERVLARLARLELDQVEDLVLAREHQVVEAQQDALALREAGLRPGGLRRASAWERGGHVLGRAARDAAERGAGERLLDLERLARAPRCCTRRGERLEVRGGDALRRDLRRAAGWSAWWSTWRASFHLRGCWRLRCRSPAAASSPVPPALGSGRRRLGAPPQRPGRRPPRSRSRRGRRCSCPAPPLTDADYFAVADEVVRRLNRTWEQDARSYCSGGRVST